MCNLFHFRCNIVFFLYNIYHKTKYPKNFLVQISLINFVVIEQNHFNSKFEIFYDLCVLFLFYWCNVRKVQSLYVKLVFISLKDQTILFLLKFSMECVNHVNFTEYSLHTLKCLYDLFMFSFLFWRRQINTCCIYINYAKNWFIMKTNNIFILLLNCSIDLMKSLESFIVLWLFIFIQCYGLHK